MSFISQTRARTSRNSGHTLMELMVVLALLAIAATILLPITARAYARFRLRLMQDSVARLMREARSRALLEGRTYFLIFPNPRSRDREVVLIREDEQSFDHYTLPFDMSIRSRLEDGSWAGETGDVAFYPDGTSDAVELLLRNASKSGCGIRLDPFTARATLILESELQP